MKLNDDVSYLFILAQILFFGLLIAFVVFIALSDRRASKRLDEEEKAQPDNELNNNSGDSN